MTDPPKTKRITKQLCKAFANMDAAPGDRALSERRLMIYHRIVEAGGFRPVSWASCFCEATGATYRVNGKHTATLFAGLDPLPELYAVVETFTSQNLDDVAKLYATFDSRQQTRTGSDINRSFAGAVPELAGVAARLIDLAVTAIAIRDHGFLYAQKTTAAARAESLLDHVGFAMWLGDFFHGDRGVLRRFRRGPVAAAMLETFVVDRDAAARFWVMARDESSPSPKSPDRLLARWLSAQTVFPGHHNQLKGSTGYSSGAEFYSKCLKAWNLWRDGSVGELAFNASEAAPVAR